MTPIEIAARALCRANGLPEEMRYDDKAMWETFIQQAQAVIEALEEADTWEER